MTWRLHGALALALGGALAGLGCGRPVPYAAERVDIVASVRPDGTVEVREALTIRFDGPVTRFVRTVDIDRADGVDWVAASLDGRAQDPAVPGDAGVTVVDGERLVVTWTFPPGEPRRRQFEVVYRARAAVAPSGQRGVLRQAVVASARDYAIAAIGVRLVVPSEMRLISGTTGIAEAGWTVASTPDGIEAERTDLGVDEGATIMAEMVIDPRAIVEPTWQHDEAWAAELIPAFLSGGLFILVIGAGILWIIRFQYPRRRPGAPASSAEDARERAAVRSGLRGGGMAAMAAAVVLAGVTWMTLSHLGPWPLALPLAIFVIGSVFVAVSARYV